MVEFANWCFCVGGSIWFGFIAVDGGQGRSARAIASLGFGALAVAIAMGWMPE